MVIESKAFGGVEVDERQVLSFPSGLFGFEQHKEFALLDAAQTPFYWLQSTVDREVAFVLLDPLVFRPDYTLDVDVAELSEIGIDDGADALCFAIVTIPENVGDMTANLQGPVVVNRHTRIARQLISHNSAWQVRHGVFEEIETAQRQIC